MKYRPATCEHGALLTEDCDDCWSGPTGYVRPVVEPQAQDDERAALAPNHQEGKETE